ncbi:hypothetical protein LLG46_13495 [bacterium]|nr:hypothetical protein [bacterium]
MHNEAKTSRKYTYPTAPIRTAKHSATSLAGAFGSTRLLTDSGGSVIDRYSYDAYGSLITHDEFTGHIDQPYQYVGELGYYTHYQEPEFGLLQLGVRFYDVETGRFVSRDPAKEGFSYYSYNAGSPLVLADPKGQTCTPVNSWGSQHKPCHQEQPDWFCFQASGLPRMRYCCRGRHAIMV